MRVSPAFGLLLGLVACGGSGSSSSNPDASPDATVLTNIGFTTPKAATHANTKSGTTWMDLGLADWSCLNTPSTDAPLTADMTLTGQVVDFMDMTKGVPTTTVTAFDDIDYASPFTNTTTDTSGNFTLKIPAGKVRVGFKVSSANYFDTFLLNQYWTPSSTTNTISIGDISISLAGVLSAFTNFDRTDGTGVLAGAMRDCSHNEVSNAIATVSSVSMMPTHLQGTVAVTSTSGTTQMPVIASSFYFDPNTDLPTRLSAQAATSSDGLFTILNLPPLGAGTNGYIQVWGFKADADVAQGMAGLTLLAELPSPVLANNVITGSIEPLRTK